MPSLMSTGVTERRNSLFESYGDVGVEESMLRCGELLSKSFIDFPIAAIACRAASLWGAL